MNARTQSKIEGDRNIFRKAKLREMPLVGEFRVYHYDENDDPKLATKIVFMTKETAEEYMKNHVDPKTDPYIAYKRED